MGSSARAPSRKGRKSAGLAVALGIIEAHLPVAFGVLAPALAHLDEQEEVDRRLGHRPDLLACRHGDRLDGRAFCAEQDFALALTRDIDGLLDADAPVLELL